MSDLSTELNLALAVDNDDQADYLVTTGGLRGSLITLDGLFSSSTGHTHGGAHQGGTISSIPASAIPTGSITSAKIADGAIATIDLADGAITTPKIATGVTLTTPTLTTPVLNTPTINSPTLTGTIAGGGIFSTGPFTTDWFRCNTINQGLLNVAAGIGIAFDAGGPYVYGGYGGGHLITETATQTLSNKTIVAASVGSPTLVGTVAGTPTWAAAQTFPAGTKVGNNLAIVNNQPSSAEWKLDAGGTGIQNANPGGNVFNIGFAVAFSAPPTLVANVQGVSGGQNTAHLTWWTGGVTASGFQLFVNNGSGGGQALLCSWLAMGH